MKLSKPYKRIIRPFSSRQYAFEEAYTIDSRYDATDKNELIRAYHLLEKDLLRLFEYIEPAEANLNTYSHRTYELLLRAATEFELNAKSILAANGYQVPHTLTIRDYFKLNAATKLSEYKLFISTWYNGRKVLRPFEDWSTTHTLKWYQDYNKVKHNRKDNFCKASLKNVIDAVAGVFSILFSQFSDATFFKNESLPIVGESDDGVKSVPEALFSIQLPDTWTDEESYDLNWHILKTSTEDFSKYPFPT